MSEYGIMIETYTDNFFVVGVDAGFVVTTHNSHLAETFTDNSVAWNLVDRINVDQLKADLGVQSVNLTVCQFVN